MGTPYNTTNLSGFVRADSILTGRLANSEMPVVRFRVVSGSQPHPMFITDVKLAVEMYAWYVTMQAHGLDKVYVAATASIVSNGDLSIMIANHIDFHISNPDARVEVERCMGEMLSGRSPHSWPQQVVVLPFKEREEQL